MYKPFQLSDGLSAPGNGPYISETYENKLMMHQMYTERCGKIIKHSAILRKRRNEIRPYHHTTCQLTIRTIYVYAHILLGHANKSHQKHENPAGRVMGLGNENKR